MQNTRGVPGVLLAGAPSAVQWDDFLSADARFTDGTLLPAGPRLQPLRGGRNMSKCLECTSDEPLSAVSLKQTKPYSLNTAVVLNH